MLQVLYLDASKIDRVLHMMECDPPATAARGGARGQMGAQMPRGVGWCADAT
jgi:hypothetical protein